MRRYSRGVGTALVAVAALLVAPAARASGSHTYTPQADLHWGQWNLAHHHLDQARYFFLLTLEKLPNNAEAHAGMGEYYLRTGQRERAREEFQTALRADPHLDAAERGIHTAPTEGEEEQAFVQLQEQALQEPDNADVRATLAEELLERRQVPPAKREAEAALQIDPREGHAMCVLGRIAAQAGDDAGARRLLLAAIRQDAKDDDAFGALGDLAMASRDWPAAVSSYRRATALFPEHAEWHRKLANALEASGNAADATREREEAKRLAD